MTPTHQALLPGRCSRITGQVVQQAVEVVRLSPLNRIAGCSCKQGFLTLSKMHVKTPFKCWFHMLFSIDNYYVIVYWFHLKQWNVTSWTQSSPQPSCMKGADKCVWCWACNLLSKQRRMVVRGGIKWGEVVRPMMVASANCGQDPQWHYIQCGYGVLVMFTACLWKYSHLPIRLLFVYPQMCRHIWISQSLLVA